MGVRSNKNTTTGGGMMAAARRALYVVAAGLAAFAVGAVIGMTVLPMPSFLEGILPTLKTVSSDDGHSSWDANDAPEYYRIVGTSEIDWALEPGETAYGALDGLGRATYAHACVTRALADEGAARPRGDLHDLEPSGWGTNAEVDIPLATGEVYHGFLWNRSHLLAKSLGGSDDLCNLVTGTRMQNVGSNAAGGGSGGMGYCEWLARNWVYDNPDGWVYYSATPVYVGDELICRSVMVDMCSSDSTLDVRVEVFNAAKGIEIDYRTGGFKQVEAAPEGVAAASGIVVDPAAANDPAARDYVVNVNTGKFHLPDCDSVDQMADHNRQDVHTTRDDLISQGYSPCGGCRP